MGFLDFNQSFGNNADSKTGSCEPLAFMFDYVEKKSHNFKEYQPKYFP